MMLRNGLGTCPLNGRGQLYLYLRQAIFSWQICSFSVKNRWFSGKQVKILHGNWRGFDTSPFSLPVKNLHICSFFGNLFRSSDHLSRHIWSFHIYFFTFFEVQTSLAFVFWMWLKQVPPHITLHWGSDSFSERIAKLIAEHFESAKESPISLQRDPIGGWLSFKDKPNWCGTCLFFLAH